MEINKAELDLQVKDEHRSRHVYNITPIQDCQQEYTLEEEEQILAMVMTRDNYKPERK